MENEKVNTENLDNDKKEGKVKKYLKSLPKRFFITAFSGMAHGLFCTLIVGTVLATFCSKVIGVENFFGKTLFYISNIAKTLMGAGIGVGIAFALKKDKITVFSSAVAGFVGAFADRLLFGSFLGGLFPLVNVDFASVVFGTPGNPIGSYVVTLFSIEIVGLYAGKTKLDIILIPLGVLLLSFIGIFIACPFIYLTDELGVLIAKATEITPFFMGIIVAVVMGVLLTMPTSSAAIWIAVSKSVIEAGGYNTEYMLIAGGAATVGCACHMIGFAVAGIKENGVSGVISQGIGTSMLQIPNVIKKPVIMLPMIISSAILGPLSACLFKIKCGYNGGGMGTCGFVGIIDALTYTDGVLGIIGIFVCMIILPVLLNLLFSYIFRKVGLIKIGDYKLPE